MTLSQVWALLCLIGDAKRETQNPKLLRRLCQIEIGLTDELVAVSAALPEPEGLLAPP